MSDRFELKAILSANAEHLIHALESVKKPAEVARKYLLDIGHAALHAGEHFGLPVAAIGTLAGGLGIEKIREAVLEYGELGEAVEKGAFKAGLSVENYQRLSYAAQASGVDVESTAHAMGRLNQTLGMSAAGHNHYALTLFQRLGITLRDTRGQLRSAADILPELADAFKRNENPAVRASMGMQLFGRQWQDIMPLLGMGGEEVKELQAHFDRLRPPLNSEQVEAAVQFNRTLVDLKTVSGGLMQQLGAGLAPAIEQLIHRFTDWTAANQGLINTRLLEFAQSLGQGIKAIDWQGILQGAQSFGRALSMVAGWVGGAKNALIALAVVINAEAILALKELAESVIRAGIAFIGMAARAYVAGNAGLIAITRTTLATVASIGPLGLLRIAWTLLATTTVSAGSIMSAAMTMVSGGIRAVGAALMANPLGIILGLASAALLIYENWDTVKHWFAGFWNWIKTHAQYILTCLGPIGWMAKTIIAHWQPLKIWFADLVHWLAGKLHWVMNAARSVGHMLGIGSGDVQIHHAPVGTHGVSTGALPMRTGPATSLLPPAQTPSKVEGQVNIKIDGLPPGSRVEQVQGGNMRMNVDAGYSANALGMP